MTPRPLSELIVRALTNPAFTNQLWQLKKLVKAATISDQTLRNWKKGMRPQERFHRQLARILSLSDEEFQACLQLSRIYRPRKKYDTSNRPKKEKT